MAGRGINRIVLCIMLLMICAASFYSGYINSVNEDVFEKCSDPETTPDLQALINARVKEEIQKSSGHAKRKSRRKISSLNEGTSDENESIFPRRSTGNFAAGLLRVSKAELLREYDFGVPNRHKPGEDDMDAMIMYNHAGALPPGRTLLHEAIHGRSENGNKVIANATVSDALSKCDAMNVIFMPLRDSSTNDFPECYVMISDFYSYHINRWMRLPDFDKVPKSKDRVLNHQLPLRHVGRITLPTKGIDELDVPQLWDDFKKRKKGFLFEHMDIVQTYLEHVDSVLNDLKKILHERSVIKSDNTVIVMTVNQGQSELFTNFICSAKRRGLDTTSILLFPTDIESKTLAEGLGIATYYDEKNFGRLPSGEAKVYGDPIFCQMMFAKVGRPTFDEALFL
eukprot:scaffold249348_cov72-Cyclotella_meneghiniana.AAC.9